MRHIARMIRSASPLPVRKALRRVGDFFGAGLEPRFPSIEGGLRTLHAMGFNPRFCVDVGAYHGEWTALFRAEFPDAKVLMVEAQEGKRSRLEEIAARNPGELWLETALLGATDGRVVSFNEMETGSSVFAEASPYNRTVVERTTRALDAVLAKGGYPSPDFLKLDVQGYELEVLKGAPRALAGATSVLLEASLVPINAECPLAAEVVAFMESAGFRLFDFCSQIRRRDGVLWQTDLLFLREGSSVLPAPILTRENWG